jgi:hypothetical protein
MHMLARVSKITDLSFVESKSNLWAPQRTGNYAQDTATGRRCADELLAYMRMKDDPLPFGQVTRAITEGGRYEAVEIGFCSRIGIHLLVGEQKERSTRSSPAPERTLQDPGPAPTRGISPNPWSKP